MSSFPEFKVERLTVAGTLTDRVVEALMELISGEDFPPGSRLPSEMAMASRFGVSRTVIREKPSRDWKSEGLVESRQGSGVFVREGNMDAPFRIDPNIMDSVQSVLQVELRLALEGEIAAFAARRRTAGQMKTITQALKQIENDEREGKDGVDADLAFHRSIAEATGNPHFLALIEFVQLSQERHGDHARLRGRPSASLSQEVKLEHAAIVDAIAKQDPGSRRAAARRHMEGATRRLKAVAANPPA